MGYLSWNADTHYPGCREPWHDASLCDAFRGPVSSILDEPWLPSSSIKSIPISQPMP